MKSVCDEMNTKKNNRAMIILTGLIILAPIVCWWISSPIREKHDRSITKAASDLSTSRQMREVIVKEFKVVKGSYAVDSFSFGVAREFMVIEPSTGSEGTPSNFDRILVTRNGNANAKVLRQLLSDHKLSGHFSPATNEHAKKASLAFQELCPEQQWQDLAVVRYQDVGLRQLTLFSAFSIVAVTMLLTVCWLISTSLYDSSYAQKKFWSAQIEEQRSRIEESQGAVDEFEHAVASVTSSSFLEGLTGFDYPPRQTSLYKKAAVSCGTIVAFLATSLGVDIFLRTSPLVGSWSDLAQPTAHYGFMFFGYPILFAWQSLLFKKSIHVKRTSQNRVPYFSNSLGVNQLKIIQELEFQFTGNFKQTSIGIVVAAFVSPERKMLVCIGEESFSIQSILDSQVLVETKSGVKDCSEMKIINENKILNVAKEHDLVSAIDMHMNSLRELQNESQASTLLVSWDEERIQELLTWGENL